jgi:hypothetical protein
MYESKNANFSDFLRKFLQNRNICPWSKILNGPIIELRPKEKIERTFRETSTSSVTRDVKRRHVTSRSAFAATCMHQGCQMVCFQTQNPNLGKFWRKLEWCWKIVIYILWPFGTYCGDVEYFMTIWYILLYSFGTFLPVLVRCTKKIWQPWYAW